MKRILTILAGGLVALAAHAFPFAPTGATSNIAITSSAQTIALPSVGSVNSQVASITKFGLSQYIFTISGTQNIFCRSDGTTATVSNATPFLAGTQVVVSFDSGVTSISCIAPGAGTTLYLTPGAGE